jgi:hypothetical protein
LAFLFYRFFSIWFLFKEFLNQCSAHPLIWAFNRLPRSVSGWIEWKLFSMKKENKSDEINNMLRQYEKLLVNHINRFPEYEKNGQKPFQLPDQLALREKLESHWKDLPVKNFPWQAAKTKDVQPILWDPIVGEAPPAETVALYMLSVTEEYHVWLKLAEDYAALHIVKLIHSILSQLWMLINYSIVGLLLLLAATASYDFQPSKYIDIFFLVLFGMVLGGIAWFIFSINRNDVLSRILKTEPNRLTASQPFVLQILAYVVLPLLGVITYYIPSLSGLFGWVSVFWGDTK